MARRPPAASSPTIQPSRLAGGRYRAPSQDRGQKRIDAILDAAEKVIVEVGVEAATTNAIAAKAGAGVGSLYHFFPNKDAIVSALSARYQADMLQLAKGMLEPEMAVIPIPEMAARIVMPMADYLRRRPAYLAVYRATLGPKALGDCHEELHQNVVTIVETLMRARTTAWTPAAIRTSAMAAVEMVHRLLEFAQGLPPRGRAAMIRETIRLVAVHSEMVVSGVDPLEPE